MKKFLSWGLVLVFGFAMFGVYAAPARAGFWDQGTCSWNAASDQAFDPSGLVGALVLSRDLNELGRVVAANVATGREEANLNFLLVSSCLPGMEGRLVAVPYDLFPGYDRQYRGIMDLNQKIDSVELNLSTEEFRTAPSFSGNSVLPANWAKQAYRYFQEIHYFG